MNEEAGYIVVAIDGPAGSGKSSVARRAAAQLGFTHLNSGALYRGVTLLALRSAIPLCAEARLAELAREATMRFSPTGSLLLNGEDVGDAIYSIDVSEAVSQVAAHPRVRKAVTEHQRRIAAGANVVIEGRDVTTVVFPDAEVKLYLDASIEERARRRHAELAEAGEYAAYEEIERGIRERDFKDKTRKDSPLKIADDATVIDTTALTIEDVVEKVVETAKSQERRF